MAQRLNETNNCKENLKVDIVSQNVSNSHNSRFCLSELIRILSGKGCNCGALILFGSVSFKLSQNLSIASVCLKIWINNGFGINSNNLHLIILNIRFKKNI